MSKWHQNKINNGNNFKLFLTITCHLNLVLHIYDMVKSHSDFATCHYADIFFALPETFSDTVLIFLSLYLKATSSYFLLCERLFSPYHSFNP